jgi:prepilin-type N-terminal cleavage/methylation domain-containing protein
MSIQKSLKKGFTLIELMVVIVIIGILAAIAIPKLFGMSAKAKAQEVGPAVGTWSKMQMAYNMETSRWGNPKEISYKLPGKLTTAEDVATVKSETSNFGYEVKYTAGTDGDKQGTAEWAAESVFSSDPCALGSKWTAKLGGKDTPEMQIVKGGSDTDNKGCISLTPNYFSIGCVAAKTDDPSGKAPVCGGAEEEE